MASFLYARDALFTSPSFVATLLTAYVAAVCRIPLSADSPRRKEKSSALPTPSPQRSGWDLVLGTHNAILCVGSIMMMLGLLKTVVPELLAGNAKGLFCDGDRYYSSNTDLYFWLYVFYMSKIYELLDTALMLARGRRPPLLHWYHHTLTLLICLVGNETQTTYAWMAMLNNTAVHSLMYCYYAYNSFTGTRLWWARHLTRLQMTQFVVNAAAMLGWIYMDQTQPGGCSGNYWGVAICMWGMVSYFALFANMYRSKYRSTTTTVEQCRRAATDSVTSMSTT